MLNVVPGKPIYIKCGLRQGNPLSAMLFILIMEPLHRLFHRASKLGLLMPLAQARLKNRMSIFADDVTVFLKPHRLDLRARSSILDMFATASGFRVNLRKSATLPIRCTQEQMEEVTSVLGCSLGKFPIK